MTQNHSAFICDAVRTPFGRYGGALAGVRTDDLAALPIKALMERNPGVDWKAVADVIYGCANQAGEDNRNVAHMASLLAGLPVDVPGATLNRLCGSGLDAVGTAARAIKAGEASLMIAGGVESMSRAPFVMPKAESAFSRSNAVYDTTIGWRFVNKLMKAQYGVDSMPETAENVADDFKIERAAQDRMALASQQKAAAAIAAGYLAQEIVSVHIAQKKGDPIVVSEDEHPRATTLEALGKLKGGLLLLFGRFLEDVEVAATGGRAALAHIAGDLAYAEIELGIGFEVGQVAGGGDDDGGLFLHEVFGRGAPLDHTGRVHAGLAQVNPVLQRLDHLGVVELHCGAAVVGQDRIVGGGQRLWHFSR